MGKLITNVIRIAIKKEEKIWDHIHKKNQQQIFYRKREPST